jgi:parallel beta-helix repeat protein
MKYKINSTIIIFICIIGFLYTPISFSEEITDNATIIVPDDYDSIQEAINHANQSDTILIKQGIYYESLTINKSINLIGENKDFTIIESMQHGFAISIHSDWVNISNIKIQNSNVIFPGIAIFVYSSNNIALANIRFENNNIGSSILNSDNITIDNNEYVSNKIGIKAERDVFKSKNFHISSNIFSENLQHGIHLSQIENSNVTNNRIVTSTVTSTNYNFGLTIEESKNCIISNNEISGYITGLRSLLSDNIEISQNILKNNDVTGIYLYISTANVHDNSITNNGRLQSGIIPRTEKGGIVILGRSPNKNPFQAHYLIQNNKISNNKGYGLYIERTTSTVSFNDFMQNTKNAFFFESLNAWNENYWNHRRIFPKMIMGIQTTPLGTWRQAIQLDLYPATYQNSEDTSV